MNVDDRLHTLSTLISTDEHSGSGQGSGFFYSEKAPFDPNGLTAQWVAIVNTWVVTNRHVAFPDEKLPNSLTFNLRKYQGTSFVWEPITLSKRELQERLLLHVNPDVDVCLI